MDSIIAHVKQLIANDYNNATISFNGEVKPLIDFIHEDFVKFIKPGANPESLANYIKTNLSPLITNNNQALIAIEEFISNKENFISEVTINENEIRDTAKYMRNYAVKNIRENGLLSYAGKEISISEFYSKLISELNVYQEPSIGDIKDLCEYYLERIDESILDSIMDGKEITVRSFINYELPGILYTIPEIKSGKFENVWEYIVRVVDHQAQYLNEFNERESQAKLAENNKMKDNPNLVGEIMVAIKDNNDLEITTEIPVVTSSLLTEDEVSSLLGNYSKIDAITDEEYYSKEFNNIKEAIDKSATIHDLETKEALFQKLVLESATKNVGPRVQAIINSINELLVVKRNNIIKTTNNVEEYTDAILGRINDMTSAMKGFTELEEYSTLYGKAVALYEEVYKKDIRDMQLASSFQLLFNRINERRLNLDATIPDRSPEVERVKIELNGMMMEIKQNILTIEHEPNNLGNITGTEIRLNLNIQTAKEAVTKAYNEKLLTEDDKEYYMSQLRGYSIAIESEKKIGYGIR